MIIRIGVKAAQGGRVIDTREKIDDAFGVGVVWVELGGHRFTGSCLDAKVSIPHDGISIATLDMEGVVEIVTVGPDGEPLREPTPLERNLAAPPGPPGVKDVVAKCDRCGAVVSASIWPNGSMCDRVLEHNALPDGAPIRCDGILRHRLA